MVILIFFCRVPKSLQTFKPIRELAAHFNSNRVIGICIIYNIYKFQENQRTKKGSLHFSLFTIHFTSLNSQLGPNIQHD